jgi:O-acetyl-ADP-ribose deacetylase (regulator of RNase III)
MAECDRIREEKGGCPTGEAVVTTAGKLPAKKVIHAVGPVWQDGHHGEDKLLASAYENSLRQAARHGLRSVAFPNISTGVYGFPKKPAAEIAISTVREFMKKNRKIEEVIFVCFDAESCALYMDLLKG